MILRGPYRFLRLLLLLLLIGSGVIWWTVRPPQATSASAVFDDIDRIGRGHNVVLSTIRAVRQLASIQPDTPREEILGRRAQAEFALTQTDQLEQELRANPSQWIPVTEAQVLLEDCRQALRLALEQAPTGQTPDPQNVAEDLARNADVEGLGPEVAGLLDARAEQLLRGLEQLQTRVQRALVSAMLARGRWLGLEAADMLAIAVCLSCLLGLVALSQASRQLRIPPQKVERMEIELIGRTDRLRAMDRCHQRVKELLEMADDFCRRQAT